MFNSDSTCYSYCDLYLSIISVGTIYYMV